MTLYLRKIFGYKAQKAGLDDIFNLAWKIANRNIKKFIVI